MAKAAPTPAIPAWTNNNLACVFTWLDLTYINELNSTFDVSDVVTMDKLVFWNKTSPESRQIEALNIASQLTKMFTGLNFAKFETGKNFATSVNGMAEVLVVATKTVADLAAVADENLNFFGEIKVS